LPSVVDETITLLSNAALPLALVALGMGLAEYGIREGGRASLAIAALKLVVHPLVVFVLAWALRLPPVELQTVVLLAALPVGANVYLMARQFGVAHAPVASSLVLSTVLAALSVPIVLALLGVASN
jgi:predicted permease